jgi:glutathione S-transferase
VSISHPSRPSTANGSQLVRLNGSRAQGILWLLEELQVPNELKIYHRRKDAQAPRELEQVYPLGKSPVITIGDRVLAESAFIIQYLCDHFANGKTLVPARWKDGQEGKLNGETESWMRYQYLLYYAEGSLMPYLVMYLIFTSMFSPGADNKATGFGVSDTSTELKGEAIPFLIRPISRIIANQVISYLIFPNVKKHLTLLEGMLETSPEDGKYLCGPNLTAADILLSYALLSSKDTFDSMGGTWEKGTARETFPKVFAYTELIAEEPGYKKSTDKIREIEGEFIQAPPA